MTNAFAPGDPVLELAALGQGIPNTVLEKDDQPWLRKAEQLKIDEVRTFRSNRPNSDHILGRKLCFRTRLYTFLELSRLVHWLGPLPLRY